ncbi:MAG TPA: hypothetical protein VLG44_02255 [Chlamydiales bacterium]|nr:hypothetical protein [Chlamydiales bacterium]
MFLSLDDIPTFPPPFALTLGFFDGVHLGHQKIFQTLKALGMPTAVLTFTNHPGSLIRGTQDPPLLNSAEQKLSLLQKESFDLVLALPFTQEIASLSYDQFLLKLKKKIPFTHLIIGKGDAFGKGRLGDEKALSAMGDFKVVSIEKEGNISSTLIRELILQGNLQQVKTLLGRPYSLYLTHPNTSLSPTLCLPPNGNYAGLFRQKHQKKTLHFTLKNNSLILPTSLWDGWDISQPLNIDIL